MGKHCPEKAQLVPTRKRGNFKKSDGISKAPLHWGILGSVGIAAFAGLCWFFLTWKTPSQDSVGLESPESATGSTLQQSPEELNDPLKLPPISRMAATEERIRTIQFFRSGSQRMELMRLLETYGAEGAASLSLLREFLGHGDQAVRRAAMRGVAATQSPQALEILQPYLADSVSIEESTEAALALATMNLPQVTPVLISALEASREPVLREHLVDALVSRPPAESHPFIDYFMGRADIPAEEKQNLLRMSGLNNTIASEELSKWLDSQVEPLRLGAYQGLALVSESRKAKELTAKLPLETDSGIRSLVYEAWGNQMDANPSEIVRMADSETEEAVRLSALKAWTESSARQNLSLSSHAGNLARLEELQNIALEHPDLSLRRVALFALGHVRYDPAAQDALAVIVQKSGSEKIRSLAVGLLQGAGEPFE